MSLWASPPFYGATSSQTAASRSSGKAPPNDGDPFKDPEAKRAHLLEAWLKDVADGRVDPGAPGQNTALGLHALPPEGYRLTILEWNAIRYWLADSPSSGRP